VPPREWLGIVHEICKRHGILLIADEVQSGFARTGRFFACEHYGVEPDLLVTAKSLGGGLPIAAVTGREEIMDNTGPGSLGGTFGGNPLSCQAALAAIETIESANLNERAMRLGELFRSRADQWRRSFKVIGEVRGLGAMQALELVRADGLPDPEITKKIVVYCYERGVILIAAGTYNNVIRLLMPLVITDEQMREALDVVEAAFREACQAQDVGVKADTPVTVA
jgi:4-aminobutyrate aminotransferase / (S)-3-amino-2-methylpropionate transaminase / 5-aminovalerate transaminase